MELSCGPPATAACHTRNDTTGGELCAANGSIAEPFTLRRATDGLAAEAIG